MKGGRRSPLTFLVSAIKMDNHLLRLVGSISSKRVSGHFSSLLSFLLLIQELKFSNAHFVEFSVFLGTQALERVSSSSLLSLEKRVFFAGGVHFRGVNLDICSASER